jgi:hypothetical protein
MKTPIILAAVALLSGCAAERHTILTVPAVSMTQPSLQPGYQAHPVGPVNAEYCQGDYPLVSKDQNIGLIDEAVMKAQRQSGATYISDVTISQKENCVSVEGTAMQ